MDPNTADQTTFRKNSHGVEMNQTTPGSPGALPQHLIAKSTEYNAKWRFHIIIIWPSILFFDARLV